MSPNAKSPPRIGWIAALNPRFLAEPSVMVLVAANLLPLGGVLFLGWDLYTLMILYWLETGVIGLFAIVQTAMAARWAALFYVPFFMVHFGGFMFGHLIFLTVMFGPDPGRLEDMAGHLLGTVREPGMLLALAGLFISHGYSFVANILRPLRSPGHDRAAGHVDGVEAREPASDPTAAMGAPYGRVVVMHLTLILGAMLTAMFQNRIAAFSLLIALKVLVDVVAHIRKNFQPAGAAAAASP